MKTIRLNKNLRLSPSALQILAEEDILLVRINGWWTLTLFNPNETLTAINRINQLAN